MTTSIIDGAFHGASFPATYVGLGNLIGNIKNSLNSDSKIFGKFTSNGNAVQINCGFPPRKVKIINTTDGIIWEWMYGMAAANSIKTVISGPTITQDTGSAITISGDMTTNNQPNGQDSNVAAVTLSSTLCGSSKAICFELEG